MIATAMASSGAGGELGMVVAKMVATNSADLGLVILPSRPRL